jgi:hypothetical protein
MKNVDPAKTIRIGTEALNRSRQVRQVRHGKNSENWNAYRGEQDWSHKSKHQSKEVLPDFPIAVEQIVGTFERALTDSDDWLAVDPPGLGKSLMEPSIAQQLLMYHLQRLYVPGFKGTSAYGVGALVGDAAKRAILEGAAVFKVWPVLVRKTPVQLEVAEPEEDGAFSAYDLTEVGEGEELDSHTEFRIAVDVLPYEDYYPDPSTKRRFEIHRTKKLLSELRANPDYDQAAVARLYGKASEKLDDARKREATGEPFVGDNPYEIELYEYWGDLTDPDTGEILYANCFFTWAGDELIRKPTPNPNWDGCSPFIETSILRIPNSIVPKALADHAVPLWRAENELFNLMLDQGMRAAWGIGQVRPDIMEAPEEIADGIPQTYTAVLKPNTPTTAKFYERVDNGDAPPMSIEMLTRVSASLNEALATPDTKVGQLPPRQVKATEIVQAMQGSGSLYDAFSARFEDTGLEPMFERIWGLILQHSNTFVTDDLLQILGPRLAMILDDLPDADRYNLFRNAKVKARGIRGVIAKERRFNKLTTILNLIATNPAFADHFQQNYDLKKFMDDLLVASGNDPAMYALEEETAPVNEPPAEGEDVAPSQLDPALLGAASGASPPGEMTPATEQRGMESQFAPNNPAATPAAGV